MVLNSFFHILKIIWKKIIWKRILVRVHKMWSRWLYKPMLFAVFRVLLNLVCVSLSKATALCLNQKKKANVGVQSQYVAQITAFKKELEVFTTMGFFVLKYTVVSRRT